MRDVLNNLAILHQVSKARRENQPKACLDSSAEEHHLVLNTLPFRPQRRDLSPAIFIQLKLGVDLKNPHFPHLQRGGPFV